MSAFGIHFGLSGIAQFSNYLRTRFSHISLKLAALISPKWIATNPQAKRYLFSRDHIPAPPEGMVESDSAFIDSVLSCVRANRHCLIVGARGAGKTTRALEIHRRIMEAPIGMETPFLSVFLQASRFHFKDDPLSAFVQLVANTAASTKAYYRKWLAKRAATKSSLVVILDDLDFANPEDIAKIEEIIETQKQHIFIGVASERPRSSACWNSFDLIKVPEWDETSARYYIEKRVPEVSKRKLLISHLEELDLFHRFTSPFEWACLLNIYNEGRIFEIFHPKHLTSPISYSIQRNYFEIAVTKRKFDWENSLNTIGKIALELSVNDLQTFDSTTTAETQAIVEGLTDIIFQQSGTKARFIPSYQSFFSGLFLAANWPNSRRYLIGEASPNLVWTPIYNCAASLSAPEHVPEIHYAFQNLARIAPARRDLPLNRRGALDSSVSKGSKFLTRELSEPRSAVLEIVRRNILESIGKSDVEVEKLVETLGMFALKLVMTPRQYFNETEAKAALTEPVWQQIRPTKIVPPTGIAEKESKMEVYRSGLLEQREGLIRFAGNMMLCVLAGYHLGTHYAEAKAKLEVTRQSPIWLQTCQVALKYVSDDDHANEIKDLISSQWTEELDTEWNSLAEKEALQSISPAQLARLEELSDFREAVLFPPTEAAKTEQKIHTEKFERLKQAFDDYAASLLGTN